MDDHIVEKAIAWGGHTLPPVLHDDRHVGHQTLPLCGVEETAGFVAGEEILDADLIDRTAELLVRVSEDG